MEKNKPTLLVIAGPNGSGKTTVTTQILKHEWVEGCVYINPDNIAQEQFGDWNSPDAVLKAAKLATEQREKCLKDQQSFIFEIDGKIWLQQNNTDILIADELIENGIPKDKIVLGFIAPSERLSTGFAA